MSDWKGTGTPIDGLGVAADGRPGCTYCSAEDIRNDFGEQWTSGIKYDAELESAIEAASRLIDREKGWGNCHYAAGDQTTSVRWYDTESGYQMEVDRCLQAGASVAVDETATGIYVGWVLNTDYLLWPYNEAYFTRVVIKNSASKVFTDGQQLLRVTGKWGAHSTPPAEVRKACMITVARWFKRAMQEYQDTGAVVEVGQLRYTKALDPDVKEILRVLPTRAAYG